MEGVGATSAATVSYGAPDVSATSVRSRAAGAAQSFGADAVEAAMAASNSSISDGAAATAAPQGKLESSTLKDLILTTQAESGIPSLNLRIGQSLSTAAPKSAVVTRGGPEGYSTVMASISTNVDGSGSSITFFAGGSPTFNFASESAASSAIGGLPASMSTHASVRAQAFNQSRVSIAA